jgi:hypothetical protein
MQFAMRLRSLLWLIAMAAFLLPSFVGAAVAFDRMSNPVLSDCGHQLPPPGPEKGTAKHAAGLCCPLMAAAVALLPPAALPGARKVHASVAPASVPHLSGLSPRKEPPPPRV